MSSRRRVWILFATCALLIAAGLAGLSWQLLRLDEEREAAARSALQEEKVRLALWRLDSALSPLLVRESGRTHGQFVRPEGEALPEEVELRFAQSAGGVRIYAPRTPTELRERFEQEVEDGWLDGQVPRPAAGVLADGSSLQLGLQEQLNEGSIQSAQKLDKQRDNILVPEQQTIAYQNSVSNAEFQRRVQSIQKTNPSYGGSKNYRNDDAWAWNSAPSNDPEQEEERERERKRAQDARGEGAAPSDGLPKKGGKLVPEASRGLGSSSGALGSVIRKGNGGGEDPPAHEPLFVRESVMVALWHEDMLLLARRAEAEDGRWIEGTWLDWATLQRGLLTEIEDLLPEAELVPVREDPEEATRLLATIPVRLVPGPLPAAVTTGWSAVELAVFSAWAVALAVALAAFFLLRATLELSERRGAFVSAVTHELRTPLTTFRMYTEMLSEGMVRDEAQQQRYIETLSSEAKRLDNLVQNVLAYARIEDRRAPDRGERLPLRSLIESLRDRLAERCEQVDGEVDFQIEGLESAGEAALEVDPTALEQILFNLVDNAAKYGRSAQDPQIRLRLSTDARWVRLRVQDNGAGIPAEERARIFRPFEKAEAHQAGTAPGVGLGLALCRRMAEQLGGKLALIDLEEGDEGPGACFELRLPRVS